jgi:hypothetical protein
MHGDMNYNLTNKIPDFPEDAMFFKEDGHWRVTRPADSALNGMARSWHIYADGTVLPNTLTFEGYCMDQLVRVPRDEAISSIHALNAMQLPEGF